MLKELYKKADFKNNHGMFFNMDCMELMKEMVSSERERERERRNNSHNNRYSI